MIFKGLSIADPLDIHFDDLGAIAFIWFWAIWYKGPTQRNHLQTA